ncbi:5-formyltetrahydrofolate cyclo-ligase [Helicobacter sp. MIT 14-3879]|uniref:5-formyltetrahydrofolate cyclo-ligase n=1 Tax=Helicobacter sp. MIT 14-3879 TaxID=2040649 RepID=UPI000E1F59A0|nr:5-formyltetrahydrofolate cyclo-ligase [Helicobacter sp. MIT 14-3879]RDU65661.1 5-formyltetrahydrofolate cyclo-ligase [Helicobacter sp. MIT 14-3879]
MRDLKKDFRNIAKSNLLKANKERLGDKKIIELIKKEILKFKPKNILLYLPMNIEINIYPLIFYFKKQKNIKIFSPFIIDDSFKIVPFRLPLSKNKYNIYQTNNSNFINFNKLDLAIIPIVGIDIDFRRIGFGKGMYDRFYARLKNKPINIFVSRILSFSNIKITNYYDIIGDIIIAKKGKKYDLFGSWFECSSIRRPFTLYNKKNLYLKTKHSNTTSKNKSHSNRKRG